MHESDLPSTADAVTDDDLAGANVDAFDAAEPVDDEPVAEEPPAADEGDAELDAMADALDTVESALKALDKDELDEAERLAASLGGSASVDEVADQADSSPEPTEA